MQINLKYSQQKINNKYNFFLIRLKENPYLKHQKIVVNNFLAVIDPET